MTRLRLQMVLALTILVVCSMGVYAPAWAQGDGWSWIVTPQLWTPHIAKNGFAAGGALTSLVVVQGGSVIDPNPFTSKNSEPVDNIDPQWGIQIAAQKGRWTLAGSFQYVDFETRSDIVVGHTTPVGQFTPGLRVAQEFVDTTRIDIDLAASYLFPDVVKDRLDFSLGAGVKVIYAEGTRHYSNVNPLLIGVGTNFAVYTVCEGGDLLTTANCGRRDRVKTSDVLYGLTIPTSATVHLTSDAKWLMPLSISPFVGAETRDDRDVVYRVEGGSFPLKAVRKDGTTFAIGVTADATVRYLLNDTLSIYGGMRVQYINGHEEYLAYGPMVGMSVRFGGK
jgi:hypothetical protein